MLQPLLIQKATLQREIAELEERKAVRARELVALGETARQTVLASTTTTTTNQQQQAAEHAAASLSTHLNEKGRETVQSHDQARLAAKTAVIAQRRSQALQGRVVAQVAALNTTTEAIGGLKDGYQAWSDDVRDEVATEQQSVAALRETVTSEQAEIETAIQALRQDRAALELRRKQIDVREVEVEATANAAEEQRRRAEGNLREARKTLAEAEDRSGTTRSLYAAAERLVQTRAQFADSATDAHRKAKQDAVVARKRADELADQIAKAEAAIRAASERAEETDTLRTTLTTLVDNQRQADSDLLKAGAILRSAEFQKRELNDALKEARRDRLELTDAMRAVETDQERLTKQIASATHSLREQEARLARIKADAASAREQIDRERLALIERSDTLREREHAVGETEQQAAQVLRDAEAKRAQAASLFIETERVRDELIEDRKQTEAILKQHTQTLARLTTDQQQAATAHSEAVQLMHDLKTELRIERETIQLQQQQLQERKHALAREEKRLVDREGTVARAFREAQRRNLV